MSNPHINELRTELLATLRDLRNRHAPMEPDRARAVASLDRLGIARLATHRFGTLSSAHWARKSGRTCAFANLKMRCLALQSASCRLICPKRSEKS